MSWNILTFYWTWWSPSQSLQRVSVVYEFNILTFYWMWSGPPLQSVSVVHESQHSHILMNVIHSPSLSLQSVSVVNESQHSHISLNVIWSPQCLQRVSVIYESQPSSHFTEHNPDPFSTPHSQWVSLMSVIILTFFWTQFPPLLNLRSPWVSFMSPHIVSYFTDHNLLFSLSSVSECHIWVITLCLSLITFSAALF